MNEIRYRSYDHHESVYSGRFFGPNFRPLWHTFRSERWQFRVGCCLWGRLKLLACWHRPVTWYGPRKRNPMALDRMNEAANLILKACRPRSFRIIHHSVVWTMPNSWKRREIDWFGSFWINALTVAIITSLGAIRRLFGTGTSNSVNLVSKLSTIARTDGGTIMTAENCSKRS